MRKLTFLAGTAVGYVLGARAGREKYEQMREAAQRMYASPAMRTTVDSSKQVAARAAGAVADRAGDRLPEPVVERLRSVGGQGAADATGTSDSTDTTSASGTKSTTGNSGKPAA